MDKQGKKTRSVVWNHFHRLAVNVGDVKTEYAQCKYCQAEYKCSENGKNMGTRNLLDHLKEKHPSGELNLKDTSVTEFVFSQDKYRAALLKWVVECDQAFTAPQQTAFLELVNSLNPNAKTVSSATIKLDLMKKYSEKFEQVKTKVSHIPGKISFTMDGWTSKNIFPFVNIRAHWIDTNWESQSILLDFSEIHGDHSGANYCNIFLNCVHRYGISTSKILAITLDNASSNNTFITSFRNELIKQGINISPENIHVRCLAHIMNLSVQDILKSLKCTDEVAVAEIEGDFDDKENEDSETDDEEEVKKNTDSLFSKPKASCCNKEDKEKKEKSPARETILTKLRRPIKKIRKSPKMRQALKETCKSFGTVYKVPIIDVKTRWNSSYLMIERVMELKEPFDDLCAKTMPSYSITSGEWNDLITIRGLLQKFHRATKFVSMDRHITISAYIPTLNWLVESLEKFVEENSGSIVDAAKKGLDKLKKYEDLMCDSQIALIALFLNPALKLSYFQEHNYSKKSIKEIEKMIQKILVDNYGYKILVEKQENNDDFHAYVYKRPKREENLTEIQKYIRYPLLSPKTELLQYWKTQELEFPFLTKMARDYLGAQSTSVPVERDFSGGVDLVTSTRCALKPETIQACMCLKSWFKNNI